MRYSNDLSLLAAAGKSDIKALNKFGQCPSGAQTTATDVWDLANATPTSQVWLAPTAARVHAVVSTDATDACGKGTLTLTENAADTNTVTIGTKVYTFQTTLTNVDGNVKIGANASASIDNLIAAINLGAGAGTTYAAATTAIDGKAFVGAGDTMSYYDHTSGAIASTDTLAGSSAWGATTIPAGTGAQKIRLYGQTAWTVPTVAQNNAVDTYEDLYLYGDDTQNTVNSYVIIHRMKVLRDGGTKINAGTISATAATDSTVTAVILPEKGQTLMAIYGVAAGKTLYLVDYHAHIMKSVGTATHATVSLLVNTTPADTPTTFTTKDVIGCQSTGNGGAEQHFDPMKAIPGPAIVKVSVISSAADLDMSGGFDGYIA